MGSHPIGLCSYKRKFGQRHTWGKTIWGHRENRVICKPKREASEKTNPSDMRILDLQLSELWANKLLLFKLKTTEQENKRSLIVNKRRRQWQPIPVLLPGKSHGRRSLEGCSPWGCEELDTTEWLHFHFSLSCIGEGNGNPLQCSCLENPRDGGAWLAAVYGVAQSRTQLKWLSSSSQ